MSKSLEVVPAHITLAMVSTKVEGHQNPVGEVQAGIDLLGPVR